METLMSTRGLAARTQQRGGGKGGGTIVITICPFLGQTRGQAMECEGHAMESLFHPKGVSPILHQLQGKIQDTCEQRCTQQIPGVTGSLNPTAVAGYSRRRVGTDTPGQQSAGAGRRPGQWLRTQESSKVSSTWPTTL